MPLATPSILAAAGQANAARRHWVERSASGTKRTFEIGAKVSAFDAEAVIRAGLA